MSAVQLTSVAIEKPWGRHKLWQGFANVVDGGLPIGEIIFEAPADRAVELCIKYLFTSERLSVQVHPNDAAARARGLPHGKDEVWYVLAAEPGATIGLGLKHPASAEALRAAAQDGSIESVIDWVPVQAGDVLFSPGGTIHAIGAGVTVIEVQQNLDLTYRLYDYGRQRALHLDDGLAVLYLGAGCAPSASSVLADADGDDDLLVGPCELLVDSPSFSLERWRSAGERMITAPDGHDFWVIPVRGSGHIDATPFAPGECWIAQGSAELTLAIDSEVLVAYGKHGTHEPTYNANAS